MKKLKKRKKLSKPKRTKKKSSKKQKTRKTRTIKSKSQKNQKINQAGFQRWINILEYDLKEKDSLILSLQKQPIKPFLASNATFSAPRMSATPLSLARPSGITCGSPRGPESTLIDSMEDKRIPRLERIQPGFIGAPRGSPIIWRAR